MSLVVVGLSHRTAPVSLLEAASPGGDDLVGLLDALAALPHVGEAAVLATCNRVEVYVDVRAFHAGVAEVTSLLAERSGRPAEALGPHLYVHFEDRAVQHLVEVAAGLDSMVVGEGQILGQVRGALRLARSRRTAGRVLTEAFERALRTGKRVHAETGIDHAGSALVDHAVHLAQQALGGLTDRRALVVGAGAMSGLTLARLARHGLAEVVVANRDRDRAERLVQHLSEMPGAPAVRAVGLADLPAELATADLVVSCTGATGLVLTADEVAAAHARRASRPLVLLDLALPRDIDPDVHGLDRVTLVDLADLGAALADDPVTRGDLDAVRAIVAAEVADHVTERQAARVAPTVVALRARADEVVADELRRLDARRPGLPPDVRHEVERTVRRVVNTLLHAPTVRVKELAAGGSLGYAEALHALFELDPARYRQVAVAEVHPLELDDEVADEPDRSEPGAHP